MKGLFLLFLAIICPSLCIAAEPVDEIVSKTIEYLKGTGLDVQQNDNIISWEKNSVNYNIQFFSVEELVIIQIKSNGNYNISDNDIEYDQEKVSLIVNHFQKEIPFVKVSASSVIAGDFGVLHGMAYDSVIGYTYGATIQNYIDGSSMLLKVLPTFIECVEAVNSNFPKVVNSVLGKDKETR